MKAAPAVARCGMVGLMLTLQPRPRTTAHPQGSLAGLAKSAEEDQHVGSGHLVITGQIGIAIGQAAEFTQQDQGV